MSLLNRKKTIIIFIMILITSISVNSTVMNNEGDRLKQSKDDLLIGVTRAICYSGFREGQHPDRGDGAVNPSYEETLEDLQILSKNSNFNLIRVYDSGENTQTILRVIKENNLNIKMMLGIWLKAEISNHEGCPWLTEPIPQEILDQNIIDNMKEIESGIRLANEYNDIIVAVAVGNEALVEWNDHMVTVEKIIEYVRKVKDEVEQEVTVADNFKWWALDGKELSAEVDFISIHVYPVWEGQDIETGLSYSIDNIQEVKDSLPEARIVITEAGWATTASEFGERASEEKQERYYNEIMNWADEMNYTLFFFEAFDEPWKGDPSNPIGAEKYWGLFKVDRTPKKVMQKLYPELMK
ncbi:MAG: glycosyl hydrolase [Ignavibacteriae bacterium]|nr:glycosyl hydrolase [Ignavibacteriota bacterium]